MECAGRRLRGNSTCCALIPACLLDKLEVFCGYKEIYHRGIQFPDFLLRTTKIRGTPVYNLYLSLHKFERSEDKSLRLKAWAEMVKTSPTVALRTPSTAHIG